MSPAVWYEQEGRRAAEGLFQQRPEWWLPAAAKVGAQEHHHAMVIYRIQIDRLTGRRASRHRP
jgi:hypothetical protein